MIEKGQFRAVLIVSGSLVVMLVLLLATAMARAPEDRGAPPEAGASPSKDPGPQSRKRVINVADYQTKGRTDTEAIQAAIDAAKPGDTVFFPGGKYEIDKGFFFASGVNHIGDTRRPAVLVGTGATSLLIHHEAAKPLRDATIQRLRFDNIEFRLSGDSSYTSFENVTLKDCVFENGRREEPWTSDYVWLRYTSGVTIDGCTFLRNAESGGRGVILERTRMSVIKESFFGTTRDLEDGAPNGYFKTAINLTGYDDASQHRNEHIVIDGNVWRRTENVACPGAACEDHGLYAWGAKDLVIRRNYTDGWTNTATGGSVKVRNSEDVFITANHFMASGIIGNAHWHSQPRHLRRVLISENRIDLRGDGNPAMGITYRRADEAASPTQYCLAPGGEDDLYIVGNDFVDGGTIHLQCATGREICVENNSGAALRIEVASVRAAGCQPPTSWVRRLGGLHRGDFNGDGKEDFLHRVGSPTSGALYWRAHLSAGDGFVHSDWGDGVAVDADTEKYGVHVGDFNGDNLDDITYRGVCGSAKCWRVHESTGKGFRERYYGNGGGYSAETLRFGLHAADFNGDGRDDIAFRGLCGSDAHPCWSILAGQSNRKFVAKDWGDGARWDPAQTDSYGLLVADFNGDDRDDIAYRGLCDGGKACLRVHLSTTDNRFVIEDWGDGLYPDGRNAPHFGMHVGDVNSDGKADIAYRGQCGSPGVAQWRYHLGSADGPFTVSCSTKYDL